MVRFDPAHQAVRDVGRVAFGAAAFAEVAGGVDGAAVVHARGAVVLGGAGAGGFAVAVWGESQHWSVQVCSFFQTELTLASTRRRDLCLSSRRGSSV